MKAVNNSNMSDNRFFYEELRKMAEVIERLSANNNGLQQELDTEKHKNTKLQQLLEIERGGIGD